MTGLEINRLHSADVHFDEQLLLLLERTTVSDDVTRVAIEIVEKVRAKGDQALLQLTRQFDCFDCPSASDLIVPAGEMEAALSRLDTELRCALETAAHRVRDYHRRQTIESWEYVEPDGTRLGQRITPLDRVGIYVPGGKAAYPSSVLMNAIPAKTAGVKQVIMTVPTPRGVLNDAVLAAAALSGVDQVFRLGGAQAIAALAYGTETIPRVDKIVGPGNAYVAAAKKIVFGRAGIDLLAGPSEVVVLCDASVDPEWVAMDLCAQAEHDELAQAIVIISALPVTE